MRYKMAPNYGINGKIQESVKIIKSTAKTSEVTQTEPEQDIIKTERQNLDTLEKDQAQESMLTSTKDDPGSYAHAENEAAAYIASRLLQIKTASPNQLTFKSGAHATAMHSAAQSQLTLIQFSDGSKMQEFNGNKF